MSQPHDNAHIDSGSTVTEKLDIHSAEELNISGDLDLSDYVQSLPVSRKTAEDIQQWSIKRRENTRTKLAMRLGNLFGGTLLFTVVLIGVVALNPKADKELIKFLIPQVITPQVTLLSIALTFYFTSKDEK